MIFGPRFFDPFVEFHDCDIEGDAVPFASIFVAENGFGDFEKIVRVGFEERLNISE